MITHSYWSPNSSRYEDFSIYKTSFSRRNQHAQVKKAFNTDVGSLEKLLCLSEFVENVSVKL